MNNFDRVLVPITWKNEGTEVILKGNFPDFPSIKMQDVYSINSKSEKSTLLWLPPGKYFYSFIVDGTEKIDIDKPKETIKNKVYNVLKVTKETSNLEIINEANSQTSKSDTGNKVKKEQVIINDNANSNLFLMPPKHNKIKSLLDLSCTFSIKGENEVQDLETSIMKNEEKEKNKSTEKVIVYNIGDDFLIPMIVMPSQMKDENMIRLLYANKTQDITLNKNDLFIQKTSSFDKCTNISDLETINELSVLRSIQLNFFDKKNYICINNIFISFISNSTLHVDDNSNYIIDQFLTIDNDEYKLFVIRKTSDILFSSEKKHNSDIFTYPIMIKNIQCYTLYNFILNDLFTIVDKLNYKFFFQINLSQKDSVITFNLIPFFPPNPIGNFFHLKSILFANEESKKKFVKLNGRIESEIQSLSFNTNSTNNKSIILAIQSMCNYNAEIFNLIYSILEKINLTIIFKDLFKLILLSYLIYNQKKYYTQVQNQIGNIISNNIKFYSNLLLINAFKYMFDIISIHLNANRKKSTINEESISLLYLFDSIPSEDNELLNEIFLRKYSDNKLAVNNNNVISSFLLSNFKENIIKHDNSLTSGDKKLFVYFENMVSTSSFIKFYNESKRKLKDVLVSNISMSYDLLDTAEKQSISYKQIWYENINSFDNEFFSKDEMIIDFLQNNKILENAKNFHGKFFCELSIERFFYFFLPILTDIDTEYNSNKNYCRQVKTFLIDLHTYQNIKEHFEIDEKTSMIKIGYQTFDILIQLMKTIKGDKALLIQKNYKRFSIQKMIHRLKHSVVIIQKKWRNYHYQHLINLDTDSLSNHILNKYKMKDPVLLKLIFDLQRNNQNLVFENQKLRRQINFLNVNRSKKCPLNLISNNLNQTNSLSITGRSFNHQYYQTTNNNLTSRTNNYINSSMTSNKSDINSLSKKANSNEVKILKEKLETSKKKYKDLIVVASEYEKKMDVFIKLINSKAEIREVLAKNGVHFS